MAFSGGGAASGAAAGASYGSMVAPGIGTAVGAVVGGLAGGFLGGDSGGGDMMPTEGAGGMMMAHANLRGMLTDDPYNATAGKGGYFAKNFDYWGTGDNKVNAWRDQLMGAAKEASNPILKAVADQVESDFARRGLTTGGAAGAAKARAMIDTAARIVLPVEQQVIGYEQHGIQGKYGLQQYAMNLALGGNTAMQERSPYTQGPVDAFLSNAQGLSKGLGALSGIGKASGYGTGPGQNPGNVGNTNISGSRAPRDIYDIG